MIIFIYKWTQIDMIVLIYKWTRIHWSLCWANLDVCISLSKLGCVFSFLDRGSDHLVIQIPGKNDFQEENIADSCGKAWVFVSWEKLPCEKYFGMHLYSLFFLIFIFKHFILSKAKKTIRQKVLVMGEKYDIN